MTIFDKLQKYFNETSKEQIQKDWNKSKKFDKVKCPTIEQFMLHGVGVTCCECKGSGGIRMDGTCARCGKLLELADE